MGMTQEISRWLDEEHTVARQSANNGPLLGKLRQMFGAILSTPFLVTFKHLGKAELRNKETFLLKVALCLRTCAEKRFTEGQGGEIEEQAAKLRKQFFYVHEYGEMMEDWLQSRIKELNDNFYQNAVTVTNSRLPVVLERIRRAFKLGRWVSLGEPVLADEFNSLFYEGAFPRHVLTIDTTVKILKNVSASGGGDFHIYSGIARAPSPPDHTWRASNFGAQDATEARILELLRCYPPFPALKRLRAGLYLFGKIEVEMALRGTTLYARLIAGGVQTEEITADEFFQTHGPGEYPTAGTMAVQSSANSRDVTSIEDFASAGMVLDGTIVPTPMFGVPPTTPLGGLGIVPPLQQIPMFSSLPPPPLGLAAAIAASPPAMPALSGAVNSSESAACGDQGLPMDPRVNRRSSGVARFQPYGGGNLPQPPAPPLAAPVVGSSLAAPVVGSSSKLGVEDDEI